MRDVLLQCSGAAAIAVALIHGYIGETRIFRGASAIIIERIESPFYQAPPSLRLFTEPARLTQAAPAWLSGLNLSLEVQNLFATFQKVTLGDGRVPAGYARYEIDPLGRTVRFAVRKQF